MWSPYLVSKLSISFKVFGECTFISFTLVYCRYMCTWDGYKGRYNNTYWFFIHLLLGQYTKKIILQNFNKMQVYMLLCAVHTLSPNCPFLSKYLVDVHLYHSHLFIVDICVHGMAIREGITTHTDFSYTCY